LALLNVIPPRHPSPEGLAYRSPTHKIEPDAVNCDAAAVVYIADCAAVAWITLPEEELDGVFVPLAVDN
jgi:hypothetical protein